MNIACTDGEFNLYPHTEYHRGFAVAPDDTMVSIAVREFAEGPFELGVEDLETIAASVLLPWREPGREVIAQAEVISEAYRHDLGITPWRPGRRGIVNPAVAPIARLCFSEASLMWRRAQVYRWLRGLLVLEDWSPPIAQGMSAGPVTLVRGALWQAWEQSPIGVTEEGIIGVHPGARARWRVKPVRFRATDKPQDMLKRVLEKVRDA